MQVIRPPSFTPRQARRARKKAMSWGNRHMIMKHGLTYGKAPRVKLGGGLHLPQPKHIPGSNIGGTAVHGMKFSGVKLHPRAASLSHLHIAGHHGVPALTHHGLGGATARHAVSGMHTGRPRVLNKPRLLKRIP